MVPKRLHIASRVFIGTLDKKLVNWFSNPWADMSPLESPTPQPTNASALVAAITKRLSICRRWPWNESWRGWVVSSPYWGYRRKPSRLYVRHASGAGMEHARTSAKIVMPSTTQHIPNLNYLITNCRRHLA